MKWLYNIYIYRRLCKRKGIGKEKKIIRKEIKGLREKREEKKNQEREKQERNG